LEQQQHHRREMQLLPTGPGAFSIMAWVLLEQMLDLHYCNKGCYLLLLCPPHCPLK